MSVNEVVKKIVTNTSLNFDECLLNNFFEYLAGYKPKCMLKSNLVDTLSQLIEHPSFVMFNQENAIRTLKVVIKTIGRIDRGSHPAVSKLLENFWGIIPNVIINQNPKHIHSMLDTLKTIVGIESCYRQIAERKIVPPLKLEHNLQEYIIDDLMSLIKFYLSSENNYHILSKCRSLLSSLFLTKSDPHFECSKKILKPFIKEQLLSGDESLILILAKIVEDNRPFGEDDDDYLLQCDPIQIYGAKEYIKEVFDELVKRRDHNMNKISKLLARSSGVYLLSTSYIIRELIANDHAQAVLIYLTNTTFDVVENEDICKHIIFLLYPLLKCSQNSESFLPKLMATSQEREFMDRHSDSKFASLSMACLKQLLTSKVVWNYEDPIYLHHDTIVNYSCLIAESLLFYIRNNYNDDKSFKHVMEACENLSHLAGVKKLKTKTRTMKNIIFGTSELLYSIFENQEYDKSLVKSVAAMLFESLIISHHQTMISYEGIEELYDRMYFIVTKARQLPDSDQVINDFLMFMNSSGASDVVLTGNEESRNKMCEMLWKELYPVYKNSEHPTLAGFMFELLLNLDSMAEKSLLDKLGVQRHIDIPMAVSEILMSSTLPLESADRIVDCLSNLDSLNAVGTGKNFVQVMESLNLSNDVKVVVEKLIVALCSLVETLNWGKPLQKVVKMIMDITRTIINNNKDERAVIKRLIANDIIKKTYDLAYAGLDTRSAKSYSDETINLIRPLFVKHPEFLQEEYQKHYTDADAALAKDVLDSFIDETFFEENLLNVIKLGDDQDYSDCYRDYNEPDYFYIEHTRSTILKQILNYGNSAHDNTPDCE